MRLACINQEKNKIANKNHMAEEGWKKNEKENLTTRAY